MDIEDPRRDKIIEAAKQSFSLFGYKGTTVDRIAKIAGVGKGTIYIFFTNKEELLGEIVRSLFNEMKKVAEAAIQNGTTMIEKLHGAIYGILVFRREHELLIKLSLETNQLGSSVAETALHQIEDDIVGFIASHIAKSVQNGGMKPCEPEVTAFVLFKMYVALVFDWEKKHAPLSDEQVSELLKLYMMEGLARS